MLLAPPCWTPILRPSFPISSSYFLLFFLFFYPLACLSMEMGYKLTNSPNISSCIPLVFSPLSSHLQFRYIIGKSPLSYPNVNLNFNLLDLPVVHRGRHPSSVAVVVEYHITSNRHSSRNQPKCTSYLLHLDLPVLVDRDFWGSAADPSCPSCSSRVSCLVFLVRP